MRQGHVFAVPPAQFTTWMPRSLAAANAASIDGSQLTIATRAPPRLREFDPHRSLVGGEANTLHFRLLDLRQGNVDVLHRGQVHDLAVHVAIGRVRTEHGAHQNRRHIDRTAVVEVLCQFDVDALNACPS